MQGRLAEVGLPESGRILRFAGGPRPGPSPHLRPQTEPTHPRGFRPAFLPLPSSRLRPRPWGWTGLRSRLSSGFEFFRPALAPSRRGTLGSLPRHQQRTRVGSAPCFSGWGVERKFWPGRRVGVAPLSWDQVEEEVQVPSLQILAASPNPTLPSRSPSPTQCPRPPGHSPSLPQTYCPSAHGRRSPRERAGLRSPLPAKSLTSRRT